MYNQNTLLEVTDDFELSMESPGDAISAVKAVGKYIYKKDKEHSFIIMLDDTGMPIGASIIGIGTTGSVPMGIAEFLRTLVMTGACGFIVMHNHPGGAMHNLKASVGDNNNTNRFIQLSKITGIVLVDDIVVTKEENGPVYFSNREAKKHYPNSRKISPKQVGEFYLPEETFPPLPEELTGWEDNPMFLSHYTEEELDKIFPNRNIDFER